MKGTCRICHSQGATIEEESTSDENEEEGDQHTTVDSLDGLYVGMPVLGGRLHEIYPGTNHCTTIHQLRHGGAEIRHHKLDSLKEKVESTRDVFGGMD